MSACMYSGRSVARPVSLHQKSSIECCTVIAPFVPAKRGYRYCRSHLAYSSAWLTFGSLLLLFFAPLLVERVELGQPFQWVSASTLTKPTREKAGKKMNDPSKCFSGRGNTFERSLAEFSPQEKCIPCFWVKLLGISVA